MCAKYRTLPNKQNLSFTVQGKTFRGVRSQVGQGRHSEKSGGSGTGTGECLESCGYSVFSVLLWAGAVILGLVLLYYIWDFVQALLILTMIGLVARCFFK